MATVLRQHTRLILVVGDLTALALFVYLGQRDHDLVNRDHPVWGVAQTTLMFAAPWILTGAWLGAFPWDIGDHKGRPGEFLSRSLNAWLVTALFGLLVRSYVLGRAVIPTLFVMATVGFGGLFLLGWRALFVAARLLIRRRKPVGLGEGGADAVLRSR